MKWFLETNCAADMFAFANILSLNNLKKKYRATFNSELNDGFIVHKGNGSQHIYKPSKKGLYYSDMMYDVITREDIICSEEIFGPNLGSIKGKTTRQTTEHVHTTWTNISKDILNNHGDVTITIDIITMNKIPFMVKSQETYILLLPS